MKVEIGNATAWRQGYPFGPVCAKKLALTKGKPTSKMTKREMSDLFELAWSFGADKGVKWSPTSQGRSTHEQ